MVVQKLRQLLAQAFVDLALMSEHDGAFEQRVLQILRQRAPQIGGGRTENQKITGGSIVDEVIGLLSHGLARCNFAVRDADSGPDVGKNNANGGRFRAALRARPCNRGRQD